MKKLQMFGFAFLLMFAGLFNVNALSFSFSSSSDGSSKITYTKEDSEKLSYQAVKVTSEQYAQIEEQMNNYLDSIQDNITNAFTEGEYKDLAEQANSAQEAYQAAEKAYEQEQNEDNKKALDQAKATYEEYSKQLMQAMMKVIFKNAETLSKNISAIAPYNVDGTWTDYTENEGEVTVDMTNAKPGDVYLLYLKADDFNEYSADNVMLFGIFTKDGSQTIEPELPETTTPSTEQTDNKQTTNPKTGVTVPIVLGISTIAIASLAIIAIRKKQLFKQL